MSDNSTIAVVSPGSTTKPPTIHVSRLLRTINLLAVIIPFVGFIATIVLVWGWGINFVHLSVFAVMYCLTGLGVTVGYHRLFTHRSFDTVWPVKWLLGVFGSMAVEGPLMKWVAEHRCHHQHSDTELDVHSPHMNEHSSVAAVFAGFWHAHAGWLFAGEMRSLSRYVGDLRKDPRLCRLSRLFPLWVLLGLLIPAVLGGILTRSWYGVLLGFLWGGLARIFLVHHVTWSINSVCHIWGAQPHNTRDESRNNVIFGFLAMGEGWHNNHHAFPNSARHGLQWWQLDLSYIFIRALECCGLAWNVKVPNAARRG